MHSLGTFDIKSKTRIRLLSTNLLILIKHNNFIMATQLAGVSKTYILNTANPHRDGTGSMVNLYTGATTYGTVIKEIVIEAVNSTSPGMIRFFLDDGAGVINLIREVNVESIIPSPIIQSFNCVVLFDFILESGMSLCASTENAEVFVVSFIGADILGYL
jgi:hypothetical protein